MNGIVHSTSSHGMIVVVVASLLVASCGGVAVTTTDPPVLETLGDGILRYQGQDVWMVVEYEFAAATIGSRWLFLDVAATAADGRSATIRREDVFVRTPAGRRVPLATQGELTQAYTELRGALRRANVVRNAPVYFPTNRRPCGFQFFAVPGTNVTYDSVTVNDRRVCYERFLFEVPGGVQPGRWMLGIDLEESDVRIPFQL